MRYRTLESSAISAARPIDREAFPKVCSDWITPVSSISLAWTSWLRLTMYCYSDTKKRLVKNKVCVARMVERWHYDSINMNAIFAIEPRLSSAPAI